MLQENKDTSQSIENLNLGYANITKAILNIEGGTPYLLSSFENISGELVKWDVGTSKVIRNLGVGSEYSAIIKRELGEASTEIYKMGGTQEEILALQNEYAKTLQRTVVLSSENAKEMFAISKVTGLAAGDLEKSFRNAGMETRHINDEMTTVIQTSRNLGVNAQVVSSMVVSNLDKMNRYGFGTGVEGMAKMAAKAAAMRVDISQTLAFADKLFSPESAIDVAATLQRLGATSGALLDPLKLMDLAQNNVPELQNQLSELSKTFTKFDDKTGKFQIMPQARQQLKEVADALGIDRGEFEKMALESAKIEKKMSEIDFSGLNLNATEDQKMMLANLAEFNKSSGTYEVTYTDKSGEIITKKLNELQQTDLDKIKAQQELEKKDSGLQLVDLAKEQLLAAQSMVAEQKAMNSLLPTQMAIGKTGNEFLVGAMEKQAQYFKPDFDKYAVGGKEAENKIASFQQGINDLLLKNKLPSAEDIMNLAKTIFSIVGERSEEKQKIIDSGTEAQKLYSEILINTAAWNSSTAIIESFTTSMKGTTGELGTFGTAITTGIPVLKSLFDNFFGDSSSLKPPTNKTVIPPVLTQPNQVPEEPTAQVRKIDHKIEVIIKAETNSKELDNAANTVFSNDVVDKLIKQIKDITTDYGLTIT